MQQQLSPIAAAEGKSSFRCSPSEVRIIKANEDDAGPPKFDVVAYTGGLMKVNGYARPIIVELETLKFGNSIIANLDHDPTKRVGNVTSQVIENNEIRLGGVASAVTEAQREVVESAANGFPFQASVEVQPGQVDSVPKGRTVTVNGNQVTGPAYIARHGILKAFAFVSHGADDNTSTRIAAEADDTQESQMDEQVKAWAEGMGIDCSNLTDEQTATIEANYAGQQRKPKPDRTPRPAGGDPFEQRRIEAQRRETIQRAGDELISAREDSHNPLSSEEIDSIADLVDHAIEAEMAPAQFQLELERTFRMPGGHRPRQDRRGNELTNDMINCALARTGRLEDAEEQYSEQVNEAVDRHPDLKGGIGLKQVVMMCAMSNGWNGTPFMNDVTPELLRFAFGHERNNTIKAAAFSGLDISTILSNNANKFVMEGWNNVDQAWQRISRVRPVRDFKQITTVSLVGDTEFELVGKGGEIDHGELSEETYTNKANTYAKMLAITRNDIINDDLDVLTSTPRKLGRGAGLKLNKIFWTAFLNNAAFFTSGRGNVSTDTGALSSLGLEQAETIFMLQTDPNGDPLGIMPELLLVPTALRHTAKKLMESEREIGSTDRPDANVHQGMYDVVSSPYMQNPNYTGWSSAAWYLLADPQVMPVIEVVALNGRVEPIVQTAEADFNVLGVQMRGISDVGVEKQEYRGGVRADGSAAG